MKHDTVIESEFTELADIERLTRHHCFWNFPLQDKDIMCSVSVGANVSLKLNRIHPKRFGGASMNHLLASGPD